MNFDYLKGISATADFCRIMHHYLTLESVLARTKDQMDDADQFGLMTRMSPLPLVRSVWEPKRLLLPFRSSDFCTLLQGIDSGSDRFSLNASLKTLLNSSGISQSCRLLEMVSWNDSAFTSKGS